MVIHFQRFNSDREKNNTMIEFPIQDFDFGQLLKIKDKSGKYINQYFRLRTIIIHLCSEFGDQYETIHINDENEFISVKDETVKMVTEKYIRELQVYMLIYEQLPDKKLESIKKNLKANRNLIKYGDVKFTPDQLCYLPCFWYYTFLNLPQPPKIITSHLICQHGQLKPDYHDCFDNRMDDSRQIILSDINTSFYQNNDQSIVFFHFFFFIYYFIYQMQPYHHYSSLENLKLISTILPIPVVQFLIEQFGGGPIVPCTIQTCEICIENSQLMRRRRKLERALIAKYDNKDEQACYVIPVQWINQWEKYLYAAKLQIKRNYVLGLPPPTKINNGELLQNKTALIQNLQEGQNYKLLTASIWKILQNIYEGGPTIILKDTDLPNQYQKKIFDQDDQLIVEEIKNIYNQCKYKSQNTDYDSEMILSQLQS